MESGEHGDPGQEGSFSSLQESEKLRVEALHLAGVAKDFVAKGDKEQAERYLRKASEVLEQALVVRPNNHKARFLLVSLSMNRFDYDRALVEGLKIYKVFSKDHFRRMNDAVLHLSLAHASKMLEDSTQAVKFAKEATELFPDDPHPYMVLGELYETQGLDEEGSQLCRTALKRHEDPQCRHPLNHQSIYYTLCCLGACLIRLGELPEAETFLQRTRQYEGHGILGLKYLIDIRFAQHRRQDALDLCREALEIDPNDDDIHQKIEVLSTSPSAPSADLPHAEHDDTQAGERVGHAARHPNVPKLPLSGGNFPEEVVVDTNHHHQHQPTTTDGSPSHSDDEETLGASPRLDTTKDLTHRSSAAENEAHSKDNDGFFFCCFERNT